MPLNGQANAVGRDSLKRGEGLQPIAVADHLTALLKAGSGQQRQYYNIMLC